jgi:hypothetical protein
LCFTLLFIRKKKVWGSITFASGGQGVKREAGKNREVGKLGERGVLE